MLRWPWISREHHAEVVAAKDCLIESLKLQLAAVMEQPKNIAVALPKDFAVIQQAIVQKPGSRRKKEPEQPPIDYAEVDETNLHQIGALVAHELGPRFKTANPWEKRQVLSSLIVRIKSAKAEKLRKRLQEASGVPEYVPETASAPEQDAEEVNAPAHIRELIAEAERVN